MRFKDKRQHKKKAKVEHSLVSDKFNNINLVSIDVATGNQYITKNVSTGGALIKLKKLAERNLRNQ